MSHPIFVLNKPNRYLHHLPKYFFTSSFPIVQFSALFKPQVFCALLHLVLLTQKCLGMPSASSAQARARRKLDRWLPGRLPGQTTRCACVCVWLWVCARAVSQSHTSRSDNGIAGPHWSRAVAPSRDPIMPVPLRVATWKRRPTAITAWLSGGEDTLSVSPRRNS